MKKQVVLIHGGKVFNTHADFLSYLKTCEVSLENREPTRWSRNMQAPLGDEYVAVAPVMPNKQNAQYTEWKIWFERHFEFLHDEVILVGWSLGGIFLAKYLSENTLPFTIKALYLVAAVASLEDLENKHKSAFSFDMKKFAAGVKNIEHISIFHSKDDFVVPYAHAEMFKAALPDAELVTFEDRNHFLQEELPELVASIKGLV